MTISNHLSDLICPCCGMLKSSDGVCPTGCNIPILPFEIPITLDDEEEE